MSAAIPKVSYGAPIFYIKKGATQPPIQYQTVDENQQLVPLTGATGVQFRYRLQSGLPSSIVTRTATIVNAGNGQVLYNWTAADTAQAGSYYCEWIVTFPDGVQTYPIRGYQQFVIDADLGG